MLSAGERPQPSMNAAVIDPPSCTPVKPVSSNHTAATWPGMDRVEKTQHIWVVTGPAGCGKSTVGKALQEAFDYPFLEGDDVSFYSSLYTSLFLRRNERIG